MNTDERILDTALRLFNKSGTDAISTNHIARAAGISPGNLYYHFHNKEEIIRALFERLFDAWDTRLSLPGEGSPTLGDLRRLIHTNFEIMWDYRFAYRELVALVRRDPELKRRFVEVRQRDFSDFRQLFDMFASAGILKPQNDPQAVDNLAELCWLISEFWLPTVEISGRAVDEAQMKHGTDLMLQVIQPYLAG